MLESQAVTGSANRVLEIRQELGKTSTKKYNAIEAAVCGDGRVRGLLQFYGANRTGRWAGRLVQVQNLPRTYIEQLDLARGAVRNKQGDKLRVLFGTTNTAMFLRDRTGNRRFWPVDVGVQTRIKTVWEYLDAEVDQIWAEAVMRWRMGESLFLTGEIENEAKAEQESHREVSSKEGIILDFVDRPVPEDWQKWTLENRRLFLNGTVKGEGTLVQRDRICALEIWCEAFGGSAKDFRYAESSEINDILRSMPGWEKTSNGLRFGYCGYQRGFLRRP